jgi:hypothetical protein
VDEMSRHGPRDGRSAHARFERPRGWRDSAGESVLPPARAKEEDCLGLYPPGEGESCEGRCALP